MRFHLSMRVSALTINVLMLGSSACAGSNAGTNRPTPAVSAASLYPLRAGCAWSYDVDSGDGAPVLATAQVVQVHEGTPKLVAVKTGQALQTYELTTDSVSRAGGYFLLHAPFERGGHWRSSADAEARIVATDQAYKTSTETYAACIVIEERHTSSEQEVTTTYCPGVGPVRIVSQMQVRGKILRVNAALRGFGCETP